MKNVFVSGFSVHSDPSAEMAWLSKLYEDIDDGNGNVKVFSPIGLNDYRVSDAEAYSIRKSAISASAVVILKFINGDIMDSVYLAECAMAKTLGVPVIMLSHEDVETDKSTRMLVDQHFTNYADMIDHIKLYYLM